jgi:hypothetical protein
LYDRVTVTSRVSAPAARQATDADQQNVDQFVSFGVVAARVEEGRLCLKVLRMDC